MLHHIPFWALSALMQLHAHPIPVTDRPPAYVVRYDCTFNEHFDRDRLERHYFAELRMQGDSSYFFLTPDDSWPPEPDAPNATTYLMDTLLRVVKARDVGMLVFGEPFLKGKDQFFADSLFPMHWEPIEGQRQVGDRICKGARAFFKGRTYICWYSTEIPIPEGPWKLGGLPGLILEAYDEQDDLHFTLRNIEPVAGILLSEPRGMHDDPGDYETYRESWRDIARHIEEGMTDPGSPDCLSCQSHSKIKFYLWEKPLD